MTAPGALLLDGMLRRAGWVLTGGALVTALAVATLAGVVVPGRGLAVDAGMAALLPRSGAAADADARARAAFGDDDVLLVAWLGHDSFTPAALAAFKRFVRGVEREPAVARVDSLVSALDVRATDDETVVEPFLRHLPTDDAAAHALAARARAHPLVHGRLVALDGAGLLAAVRFEPGAPEARLRRTVAAIRAASRSAAGNLEEVVSGPLAVRLATARALEHDLWRVTPMAVLATLAVALLGLRSLAAVVLAVAANGAATLAVAALFVAAGRRFDFVTVMLPPVVYVVGFAYAVHVLSAFAEARAGGLERQAAAARALRETARALTLAAVTTAVGLAALGASDVGSIGVFGRYAALGTVLAWCAALTLVPTALARWPIAIPPRAAATDALARRLAGVARNHRRAIVVAGLALTMAGLAAAPRLQVDTDVLGNLAADGSARRQFEVLATRFAGPVPLRVLVEAQGPRDVVAPAALRAIADLAADLRRDPAVGGVYALSDQVALLHRALAPDAAEKSTLPARAALVDTLLLAASGPELARLLDPARRKTVLEVHARSLSTAAVDTLARRIETRLARLPPDLRGSVTGTTVLAARAVDGLTRGQATGLAWALGGCYLVLALGLRSARCGALALLPNLVPVAAYFLLLACLPFHFDLATCMVACAVLGIAVDDTVVLMTRYARESARATALETALADVLRPATLTSLALVAGFLALGSATLRGTAEFGVLAALTLAVAWLTDITFTAALCTWLQPRTAAR